MYLPSTALTSCNKDAQINPGTQIISFIVVVDKDKKCCAAF